MLTIYSYGCKTNSNINNDNAEIKQHITHEWSVERCGEYQYCVICKINNTVLIQHNYSKEKCNEKQYCLRCDYTKDEVIKHTTEDGLCERCGEYYISKENKIKKENLRHENKIKELNESYNTEYSYNYNRAKAIGSYIIHSRSYVVNRIDQIN